MRLAKVLGGLGRVLIWSGTIVLLFVAYQLWGTNLAEARAQDNLEDDFAELLATTTTTAPSTTTTTARAAPSTTTTTTTTTTTPPPPPVEGEAVARMVIPRIGVDKIVVEGVSRSDLQKGPGHYPGTPLPGQPGNSAIAGHRTTYGAPFNRVDELEPGDEILVTTLQGTFRYEVSDTQIVTPADVHVVEDQGDDRLTLTSCHPKFSARQRIIVSALLVDDPAPATPQAPDAESPDELPDEDQPDADADTDADTDDDPVVGDDGDDDAIPDDELDDEPADDGDGVAAGTDLESLDGDVERTATPAVIWGSITAIIWLAFYALSRVWRRWPAYVLGAPVFGVSLFLFFGAFSELLPSNF